MKPCPAVIMRLMMFERKYCVLPPSLRVEHLLDEGSQERAAREAVRADVRQVGDRVRLAHLRHRALRVEAQVRVERRRAAIDKVGTHARAGRRGAQKGEDVGEVERVAVEAQRAPRQLGRSHVLQPDEDGLGGAARHAREGADTDVDGGVLCVEIELRRET